MSSSDYDCVRALDGSVDNSTLSGMALVHHDMPMVFGKVMDASVLFELATADSIADMLQANDSYEIEYQELSIDDYKEWKV